jgi:phage terminase large subunit GpA-like protein
MIDAKLTGDDRQHLADWMADARELIETRITRLRPSEWAERKRVMPTGLTSLPGPFRWETTPYLREIIDLFSPASQVQRVAIMKGAQLGFSVGVLENLIGWIIDAEPGPTLFVTADKELAESVIETRVDRMIETAGIAHKIFAQVEKAHGRKTGDTKSKKEFPGGFLLPVGPNVAAKLRSYSIKTILFDEVDGFPLEVGSEGDPIKLAERRTDAFSRNRKILYISTPTVEDTSRIKPLFESGDQSRFFVPCPHCGAMQALTWSRMHWDTDENGRLVWGSVRYDCDGDGCGKSFTNDDKATMLPRGHWRPTATPSEPGLRSFHLSSLYSPIGFRPWESIVQEWLQVKDDPARLRVFVNTVLGETWQERGEAPRWERIMLRREDYFTGTLPAYAEPLILTLGADVQADRIEAEVVAWGRDKESWSVSYHVMEGDTSDPQGRAWRGLYDLLTREHAGMQITLALVDAGFRTSTVYAFCEQFAGGVMPCMGESAQSWGRRTFAVRDVPGFACKRVDIQTGILKAELYGYLQRGAPTDGESYPAGYCHFPAEYGERHFRQLTAEERVKEKMRNGSTRYVWKLPGSQRNEQLDARVYAMTALYVVASMVREEIDPIDPIEWSTFWDLVSGRGVVMA